MDYRLERQRQHERRLEARGATFKPSGNATTLIFVFDEKKEQTSTKKSSPLNREIQAISGSNKLATDPIIKPRTTSQQGQHSTNICVPDATENTSTAATDLSQQSHPQDESMDDSENRFRRPGASKQHFLSVRSKKDSSVIAGSQDLIQTSCKSTQQRRQLSGLGNIEGEWSLPVTTQSRRAVIQFGLPLGTLKDRKLAHEYSYGKQDKE
ncbi:hypothetical protein PIIN_00163 [Serendipita indica DSM 11827]|uniref:Uncharacterized protein n=1 Tax=Serendipita indica (strain DSM 11827) TaxID=1109443 RepID=G4T5A7_SERID|nr:hypothetical protein PIIN_00163 [Serendipita indica DSM 11827]